MAKLKQVSEVEPSNQFRFNLVGIILFTFVLTVGASLLTYKLSVVQPRQISFLANNIPDPDQKDSTTSVRRGAWGELLTENIKLERPIEYIGGGVKDIHPMVWVFSGISTAQLKDTFVASGMASKQAEEGIASGQVTTKDGQLEFKPSDDFILSLSPEVKQKLYGFFYGKGVYHYSDYPYIFSAESLESIYANPEVHTEDLAMLKKLVFPAGKAFHLVEYPVLMLKIPTAERKTAMAHALSQQSAVLARLCIRPDSDIDKIANYWGHVDNVRFTNVRPLLESLKRLPNGGTVSIAYLMPPFARERLYTYPLPPEQGEPVMDCHWSTFNFGSTVPDNRFNDTAFAAKYIVSNYYTIDVPNVYGDVILLMNERNEIKHSAVYLADDLAFTKYGNNHTQPWMLVHISDMQEVYPTLKLCYMRKKKD